MKMIVNGKKVDSESGLTFDIINPATGEVIEAVPKATEKDVIAAIDAAEKGQKGLRCRYGSGHRFYTNSLT